MRRRHAPIASSRHEPVQQKAGPHGELTLRERSIEWYREGEWTNRVRRDAGDGPPLAHRFAGACEVERLQITHATMNGTQVIERRTAAEVVPLDERHRQSTLRRV